MAGSVDMPVPKKAEPEQAAPVEPRKEAELVSRHSYGSRQFPPTPATERQGEQSAGRATTFEVRMSPGAAKAPAEAAPPRQLPDMFTDRQRVSWDVPTDQMPPLPGVTVPVKEAEEEPEDGDEEPGQALGCATGAVQDPGQGIGPQELDWIIALCNGLPVPDAKRQAIVRAIRSIRGTQIQRALIDSINGSDSRIARFLDEAEREAAADGTDASGGGFDMKPYV